MSFHSRSRRYFKGEFGAAHDTNYAPNNKSSRSLYEPALSQRVLRDRRDGKIVFYTLIGDIW